MNNNTERAMTLPFWNFDIGRSLRALKGILIKDPRWAIAAILCFYNILGFTVLGFNRSPWQMLTTSLLAGGLEVFLCYFVYRKLIFPLSAIITSFSLSLILNYSHTYLVLGVPVFLAIGSKYLLTYKGKHFFNPALTGVTLSLFFFGDLISAAPAYQWTGIGNLSFFMVMLALVFLMPRIQRHWLVLSFLGMFTLQTALRAFIMRHHLPFETLFFGTLTSPSFILFTFFMITDPATSPKTKNQQIIVGCSIALLDLVFHLRQSYFTFFYAGFCVASCRFLWMHAKAIKHEGLKSYFREMIAKTYLRRILGLMISGGLAFSAYASAGMSDGAVGKMDWVFKKIQPLQSDLGFEWGDVWQRTDPRLHHMIKWIFSVGDSVAVGDFDGDGSIDLFLSNMLKADADRALVFRNLGQFRFERVEVPALKIFAQVEKYGLPTNGLWVDYDNDSDLDLFVTVAFGSSRLFQNQLKETGKFDLIDVTEKTNLLKYSNSISANFLDFNRDGRLDLFVANVWPNYLLDYQTPTELNLFHLPAPQYEGDERALNFMHASWNLANNGGQNILYLQTADGKFEQMDSEALGIPETRWSLAVGTADLNQDGWTDIYVANDFGPDDLYFNEGGKYLRNHKGELFGSIGKDTYKGMNASIADLDRNGFLDVYVSNVHHALQAEGSLLWLFGRDSKTGELTINDRATQLGALNPSRFGWGASLEDFDNDGWVDIIQANGMVDDSRDRTRGANEDCPDYWYVNEKIARSPPSYHRYASKWGDIRGMCIYGFERNRVYINPGSEQGRRFVDVAESVGLGDLSTSRGVAAADFDNDGRKDILITHLFKDPTLAQNSYQGSAPPNWIGFGLQSEFQDCNRRGLGTVIEIVYSDQGQRQRQRQETQAATGFSAQSDSRVTFGLGQYQGDVEVLVNWCGQHQRSYRLPSGQYHQLLGQVE